MAVTHLETVEMTELGRDFRKQIQVFDDCVLEMDRITSKVLNDWKGKGRNEFEVQVKLLKGQLEDLSDSLYAMYGDLVEAEKVYIDQDIQVAKRFSSERVAAMNEEVEE